MSEDYSPQEVESAREIGREIHDMLEAHFNKSSYFLLAEIPRGKDKVKSLILSNMNKDEINLKLINAMAIMKKMQEQ
jgi:hypothetical protein